MESRILADGKCELQCFHTFCGCAGLLHILCLLGSGTAVMAAAKATHMHVGECLKFNPHHEIFSQNMPYQTELLKHF